MKFRQAAAAKITSTPTIFTLRLPSNKSRSSDYFKFRELVCVLHSMRQEKVVIHTGNYARAPFQLFFALPCG